MAMNLSIVIPCYNEEKNIPRIKTELIPALEKLGLDNYEIILVDDGSTDRTYEAAQNLGISRLKIVRHEKNRNIGAAFKTGFGEATRDACLTYDSDFTYPVEYIEPLVKRFMRGDVDFVSGSPELAGFDKNTPLYRRLVSRLANAIYGILLGKKVTAVTHTFRICKTDDIRKLDLETDGFDIGAEMFFKLIKNKKTFDEIPAPLIQRKFGESKLDYKKEIWRHLFLIKKIFIWRAREIFN